MGAIAVIVNAILYSLLFVFTLAKNKRIGPIEILLAMYMFVAFCGVNLYFIAPYKWNISLWRYIYLFFIVFVFTRGITNNRAIIVNKNPIVNYSFYKIVSILYVALSLFSCIYYIPQVIALLQNPEWADIYAESHDVIDGNIITKIANAFFHLRYLGVVLFFAMLSHEKCSNLLKVLLGIGAFLPVFLVTILNASRGGLIILVASLVMAYFIFLPTIPHGIRKKINRFTILSIPIFVIYFIAVSISRFEDALATGYTSASEAFWDYLGHSMMYFNNGVMDCITHYGKGSYMFALQDNAIRGTNFGSNFITFVGCLYLDYGAVGTLLIGVLVTLFFKKVCRRRIGIPELFLLLNYLMYLFYGVFVTASGFGYQWIEIFIIYFGLKFFERR